MTHAKNFGGAALEIGSAAILIGVGARLGIGITKALAPKLGKKIAQEIGTGLVSGGLSGAVGGFGQGMLEDKNPVLTSLGGGTLGALGGKTVKDVKGNKLSKMLTSSRAEKRNLRNDGKEFYRDYIQGTSINREDLGTINFDSEGLRETGKQQVKHLSNLKNLKKNIKEAEYITTETPIHPHKNIKQFHRLRKDGEDFLIAETKNGKKFYIAKDTENKIPSKDIAAETEYTLDGTINSIPKNAENLNPNIKINEEILPYSDDIKTRSLSLKLQYFKCLRN